MIIGQAPSRDSNPAHPISGRCGKKLADLIGVSVEEFLVGFERHNLLDRWPGKAGKGDAFPIDKARRKAVDFLLRGVFLDRRVVLLGENVASTFGLDPAKLRPLRWQGVYTAPGLAFCPHPSGVNRWWNEPGNVEAARRFWRRAWRETLAPAAAPGP